VQGRRQLFSICVRGVNVSEEVDWDDLVRLTEGYSGADIASVCRDAAMMELRNRMKKAREEGIPPLEMKKMKDEVLAVPIRHSDFVTALQNVQKSVGKTDMKRYEQWMAEFGAN